MNLSTLAKGMLCICLAFFSYVASAQTKVITGKVTDAKDGSGLSGVSVLSTGGASKAGSQTTADGSFKITVPAGTTKLVFTIIGYAKQEVTLAGQTTVSVALSATSDVLNDVVVIGYGTARKRDITGAVSQISSKDFTTGNLANPLQAIQGKVAGLAITVSGGDPNGIPIVKLRGQNSLSGGSTPLFVVDNVPLDDPSQMTNIPAADIVSYDVLKDVSATAIYGSRGAAGVILITTRRGHSGDPEVSYSGSVSIDNIAHKLPVGNASDISKAYGMLNLTAPASNYNTDWQDAMTRSGVSTNHSVSLIGGGKGFSYRGTAFYNNMQGVILNTGKNAAGVNLVLQQKALKDKLDIQTNITYSVTNRQLVNYNEFYSMIASSPLNPVYTSPGVFAPDNALYASLNPVWAQTQETSVGKEVLSLISGSIDYSILPYLKVGVWGGLNNFTNQVGFYQPVFTAATITNPTAAAGTENRWSTKGNMHINFNKSWGKNSLAVSGVYEYNDYFYNNNAAFGQGYINDNNTFNYLQGGLQKYNFIFSDKEENKLISFLGRAQYNYDSKYYLTVSARQDGSSKFGVNDQWGTFPSVSAAWRISNEKFMKNVSWVNELKLRGGFGFVGNQDAIGNYQSQLLYSANGNYYNAASGNYLPAYGPTQNANPNLQWERTEGTDVGFDYSLLNNRLSGTFSYFSNKTDKLLNNYQVPFPAPGFVVNTILANVGTMTNKGLEFVVNYNIIRKHDFSWTIGGNIATVKSKVISLSGSYSNGIKTYQVATDHQLQASALGQGLSTSPLTYFQIGYTPYVFDIAHFTGFNSARQETFDAGGGTTTTNPLNAVPHFIDPSPKFNYAITNSFSYQDWGLSFILRGVAGQKIYDNTRMIMSRVSYVNGANILKEAISDNDLTSGPEVSDLFLEKAGYLRLDNLTLSKNFKVAGIRSLRVYLAANNLFVITKYVGFDPEIKNSATVNPFLQNYSNNQSTLSSLNILNQHLIATAPHPNQAYVDGVYSGSGEGYYPKTRSFTLGVNITLK